MASEWSTSTMGDAAVLHMGPLSVYVSQIGNNRYMISSQICCETIEASSMKTAKAEALRLVREAVKRLAEAVGEGT